MNRKEVKYRLPFMRTTNWWTNDWREISDWCRLHIGDSSKWDYMDGFFCFKEEKDYMWFKLTWQ